MARPKLGEGETHRLHLKVSDEELTAIDDWRFANRISSRSDAIRRLVQMALSIDATRDDVMNALQDSHAKNKELNESVFELLKELGIKDYKRDEISRNFVRGLLRQLGSWNVLTTHVAGIAGKIALFRKSEDDMEKLQDDLKFMNEFSEDALAIMSEHKKER